MARLEYLDLLEQPETRDAVLAVVVHVAFADGVVQDEEFTLLQQLAPRQEPVALRAWVADVASRPLDLEGVAKAIPAELDRWKVLRFAARMAWSDHQLLTSEKALLVELAAALDLPTEAVEQVLDDVVGRPHGVPPDGRVDASMAGMPWEELEVVGGRPRSGLAKVVPEGAHVLAVLSLQGVEQVVVCREGLAGGFREGDGFLPWGDVKSYTRVPVFGAAVRIESREGGFKTLSDVRLRPIGLLLDRIFGL